MATVTITIHEPDMEGQDLQQTCQDMFEFWFDWSDKATFDCDVQA